MKQEKEKKGDNEWEQISREQHWKTFKPLKEEDKKEIETHINLKTIITDGYFGTNGVYRPKSYTDKNVKKMKAPLY